MPQPIYAIGDIHGQLDELERVLSLIDADGGPDAAIVFVGDYVDRGPESRGVIDLLTKAQDAGRPWTMLKGNHDRYFQRFLTNGALHDPATRADLLWLNPRLGGDKTLLSYGIDIEASAETAELAAQARAEVPQRHVAFLEGLPSLHVTDELIFVHAGIRPGVPLDDQTEDDLVWIRDPFLTDTRDHGKLVVHGHTALDQPQHHGNRVNLDAGAGYLRPLHAAVFEGRDCWRLTDAGRVALLPTL